MTADGDAVDALVGDLTGHARAERAELVEWLLARDFEPQQIGGALVPVLLAANRIIGDDGTHVSVDEICADGGFDEEFLHRLHRAVGLPASTAVNTPPSRADAESVLHARAFLDLGFDPDEVVAIVRVLVEGLGRAAETMRKAALKAVLRPGATEVQLAQSFERLASSFDSGAGTDDHRPVVSAAAAVLRDRSHHPGRTGHRQLAWCPGDDCRVRRPRRVHRAG